MKDKKTFWVGLIALMVAAISAGASPVPEWLNPYDGSSPNTIALYRFEAEGIYTDSTTTYSGVIPDQTDRDRDAYYPTSSATCSFGTGGRFGEGLHVPGGSSSDSRCTTFQGTDIFPSGADPSLSIECWVRFSDNTGLQFLLSKGNAWSTLGGYDLWLENGVLKFALCDSNGIKMFTTVSWTPSIGAWYHVAATWNAATDTARIFIDGNEWAAKGFPGSKIVDHTARGLSLGQRAVATYYGLDGTIDEVRISNVAYEFLQPKPDHATYPWGEKFWFSFYSLDEADTQYALEHGATGLGPVYNEDQAFLLDWAETYDARVAYKVRPACMTTYNTYDIWDPAFVWPDDATISNDTVQAINAVKFDTNIAMWDLHPEEMLYYRPTNVHYLELVAGIVHEQDPFGRPMMMYESQNRTAANLSVTLPYQDICSKGMYVQIFEDGRFKDHRIWARWSMEQELGAIAASNSNAAPWIVLGMSQDAPEGQESLIESWCRHDAYMGLIMGGKGISIWSGWRGRSTWTNDFQTYFDAYLSVAADLNLERNLAPVFLQGTETAGVTHNVTAGPAMLELVYPAGVTNSYPPVTYTMLEFLGQHYLFMVNSATQAVTLVFSGVPDTVRTDLFQGLEYPASGGSFATTLAPYEVGAFRFSDYEAWRAIHFPSGGDDGEADDPDTDGRTNLEEYHAGTDPNVGTDFFKASLSFSNGWKNVSFNTSSNRFYNVDMSSNLAEGAWLSMLGNEQGTGMDLSVLDSNLYPNAFYRIQTGRP